MTSQKKPTPKQASRQSAKPAHDFASRMKDYTRSWIDPSNGLHHRDDIEFISDVEAAINRSGTRFAYVMSLVTAFSLLIFIMWAAFAVLDEVTKGDAHVIPSSRVQMIQSLDGGIVEDILVKEGDIVEKDQVLLRIDTTIAETNLKEREARYNYLDGMVTRLMAEINGSSPQFSEKLRKEAPQVVTEQINQFNLRRSQQSAELSVLQSQVSQRSSEVREMQARLQQLNGNLSLKEQELNMRRPLVEQGAMSRVELLRIEGEVTDLRGEINTINTAVPRANSAVVEAQQRISELRAKAKSDAQQELAAAKAEMDALSQTVMAGAQKVEKTQLKSPVRGTVKQMKVNTIGGVIRPGDEIIEIVPLNDTLLIEARISPKDIAFIRPGQTADVRISAYDSSVYGSLDGTVEGISADTIVNDKGESFYRVTIRTKQNSMLHRGKELPIMPGMTANVQIMTGKKTVLDYMLKPVMKARQEALRER